MEGEIRWEQRFSNYKRALNKLEQSIEYITKIENFDNEIKNAIEDELIKDGLIKKFEFTYELAWNVMKDYATFQGNTSVNGSRDAIREAFQLQIIADGETWMDMLKSRNKTSHTYNEYTAQEIYIKIIENYYGLFAAFRLKMEQKIQGEQTQLF